MSTTCHYSTKEAIEAGVKFTPIIKEVHTCVCGLQENCECWVDASTHKNIVAGYHVVTPDGVTEGFALDNGMFQCKRMNQALMAWFLRKLRSAHISM